MDKISFGIKANKTTLIQADNTNQKENSKKPNVQYIEYLEGSSIRVIGGEDDKVKEPLVIPMKPNKKLLNLEDIVKNNFVVGENDVKNGDTSTINTECEVKTDEKLSLNELAAKELLQDAKNEKTKDTKSQRVIETVHPDKLALEGEKEPTLDDYENVPIEEYGLAMLRGMGWKEGAGIGKNQKVIAAQQPQIRPKGLGLGADKVAKQNNAKAALDKDGKPLICCRGAFVKVIAGYYNGTYGQIIGLDDESGRFIVKTARNNMNISLNEFLVTPVTKDNYNKNSKVINNAKYEEYLKKIELAKNNTKNIKNSSTDEDRKNLTKIIKKEKYDSSSEDNDDSRNKNRKAIKEKFSSENEERSSNKKRDSKLKNFQSSSEDETDDKRKDKKRNSKHDKKYDSSSESSPERSRQSKKEKTLKSSKYDNGKSSKYENRRSKKSSKQDKTYESSSESSSERSRSTRKVNKPSKSSRYDDDRSSKYQEKSSRKYDDRFSKSSRNEYSNSHYKDRSSKYDNYSSSRSNKNYDSSKSSKRRDSSSSDQDRYRRKEKNYSSDSDDDSRYKKKSYKRERSVERNSHKSSRKDKERERSRQDKYQR